jgi:AAHS family 4-hydroxybenzoate transporter-like MFS transporter
MGGNSDNSIQRPQVTRRSIVLICAAATTLILDGLDQQMLPLAAPLLMREWAVSHEQIGMALTAAVGGMAIGTFLGGYAGDRFGRRALVVCSTLVFGTATFSIGLASAVWHLVLLRLIGGIAFGSLVPNAMAMVSQSLPKRARQRAISFLVVMVPVGAMLGAAAASWLLPAFGWRTTFFVSGMLPLVIGLVLALVLPRADVVPWGASQEPSAAPAAHNSAGWPGPRDPEAAPPEAGDGILAPEARALTLGLWMVFFANGYAVYALFNWMPVILSDAGLPVAQASRSMFYFLLATIAGSGLAVWLVELMGQRKAGLILVCLIAASMALMALAIEPRPLGTTVVILVLVLTGTGLGALQTVCYIVASGYTERKRASGIGFALGFNRLGGMLTIVLGGILLGLADGNAQLFFIVICCVMAIGLVGLMVMGKRKAQK